MFSRAIRQWKGPLLAGATFAVTAFFVNPYYWPAPVARLQRQFSDIRRVLDQRLAIGEGISGIGNKVNYTMQIVFGDLQGLLFFAAAIPASEEPDMRMPGKNSGFRAGFSVRFFTL